MIAAPHLTRPLQRRCQHCRRVQDVRLPALYHVVVPNKGGGTRRDGGYDCRVCGTANVIPANEMPQGLVLQLPSRAEWLAAKDAVSDTTGASPSEPSAPDAPMPAPPPTPAEPKRAAVKRPPSPAWIVGTKAQAVLVKTFAHAREATDGSCTAFVRTRAGALLAIDARDAIGDGDILDWLDRTACELLVLAGSEADGARWKAVFHPFAGAATLAVQPVAD